MSDAKFVEDQIKEVGFDETNDPKFKDRSYHECEKRNKVRHPSKEKGNESVSSTSEDENGEDEDDGSVVEGDDGENEFNDEDDIEKDEVPANVEVAMSVVEGGNGGDEDTDTENEVVGGNDKDADKPGRDDDVLSKSVEEEVEAEIEVGVQDVDGAEEINVEPVVVADKEKKSGEFCYV